MKPLTLVIVGLILMLIGAIIIKKVFTWALFLVILGVIIFLVRWGFFRKETPKT